MATVRRKGNRLQVQIRLTGYPPETRYFPLDAEPEARAWGIVREAEIRRGATAPKPVEAPRPVEVPIIVPPLSNYPMTLREALERYKREVTPTKKGAQQENSRIKLWLQHPLADMRLVDITAVHLTDWRRAEEAKPAPGGRVRSPSTVRAKINLISAVYRYARSEWAMPHLQNPVSAVIKPKQRRGRDVRLSPAQRETFWNATRSPRRANWVFYICKFASLTAMRQGEILSMTWGGWSGESVIHLEETKNGTSRDVPLSSEAVSLLLEWRELSRNPRRGPIFPVTASAVREAQKCVNKYIRKRDPSFPHVTFHDLRHIAATDLSKKLSNVLELSAVTGHKSIQVLKRYYNPDAADLARKLG